jgi:hypothetical protein
MHDILPFALIVVFGVVAILMRKVSPRVSGIIALTLGLTFIVFMLDNPEPRGRYIDALFAMLGIGIGLQRLGVFRRNV